MPLVQKGLKRSNSLNLNSCAQKRTKVLSMLQGAEMCDLADFERLNQEMKEYDEKREKVIKRSRDVLKNSKQAIFGLQRGDFERCDKLLKEAEEAANELMPLIQEDPMLRQGSFANSLEEFAEAWVFRTFLKENRLASSKEVPLIERDEYLGGVLDFTGELMRFAVLQATSREKTKVQQSRDLVEVIMDQFLQFDLRNGNIRKKYDVLKYTLKKLENTLYELSLLDEGKVIDTQDEPMILENNGEDNKNS
eukprot:TRINITY_DN11328_c0_g1_i1.p2 TRINITY_DN11328_c0_g1~~TRINITY_DN11328_c0_g1_i1.p2  ORF type:complete len:250 (+),score=36.71 TRINITY_DN11328_c0_g1_i1:125-874(+)